MEPATQKLAVTLAGLVTAFVGWLFGALGLNIEDTQLDQIAAAVLQIVGIILAAIGPAIPVKPTAAPTSRLPLIALVLIPAFALAGCKMSPAQRYAIGLTTYTATVNGASDLAEAGRLSYEDAQGFEVARRSADAALGALRLQLGDRQDTVHDHRAAAKVAETSDALVIESAAFDIAPPIE